MIEHLPSVTCTDVHVLGLVLNAFGTCLPQKRLTADRQRYRVRYPIYFVVKNRRLRVAAMAEPWGS